MRSVLEIDSVMKRFGDRMVLSDVYLKCQTGDIIGLLGRNGTGKSTLLKILFGVMPAEGTFIRIDGKVFTNVYKTVGEVCYLPQHDFLLKNITVLKTARLYLNPNKIDQFFDDPIIGSLVNNKAGTLSGGELRYLEIKLLLNTDVKFVLLDEPFNGIAPVVVDQLKQMIRTHAQTKGIILTDHDYNNVLDVANQCWLLHDGGIKSIASRQDLVQWQYLNQ